MYNQIVMKKLFFVFAFSLFFLQGCKHPTSHHFVKESEVAVLWADMSLFITKETPSNSPTFASRALGYLGLTMYESVVHSSKAHRSLAGQLNGLTQLPVPENGKEYNWVLSLNAGQAFILRNIYVQTSPGNRMKIDSLEKVIHESIASKIADREIANRSIAFGRYVASTIFEWSKTDGGHRGYLTNFDTRINYRNGPGYWKAPFFAQTISRFPLHPHWGKNRTFLKTNENWKMPALIPYDSSKSSEYHKQYKDVYQSNLALTQEQKEIAMWWNDDPSDTFTPPGHSYNLASIMVRSKSPDLVKAAETYARVGLAVADAFIICWKMKYYFFTERPSTFISEHIDDEWEPFWPDPPFPAFPSGHAAQAAAVAVTLSDLYPETTEIVDDTHSGRPMDKLRKVGYNKRSFNSFWKIAEETAYSRFLGGIHSAQDNLTGLSEGSIVGVNIKNLKWKQ